MHVRQHRAAALQLNVQVTQTHAELLVSRHELGGLAAMYGMAGMLLCYSLHLQTRILRDTQLAYKHLQWMEPFQQGRIAGVAHESWSNCQPGCCGQVTVVPSPAKQPMRPGLLKRGSIDCQAGS